MILKESKGPDSEITLKADLVLLAMGFLHPKKDKLIEIFELKKISLEKDMAFTCGSGVTACILGLANSIISGKTPVIYDGSWSEYGLE